MLIWLGKTYLGQKDQPDTNLSQHTNIAVDAALLSNLQQSYQSTLSDIRRTKALSLPDKLSSDPDKHHSLSHPDPLKEPAYLGQEPESGTLPTSSESESLSSVSIDQSLSHSEDTQRNSLPISEVESNDRSVTGGADLTEHSSALRSHPTWSTTP